MFVRVIVQQISDIFETQCSSFSLIFCRGSMQWTAVAAFQRFIVRCSFTVMSYSVTQRSMTWGVHIYYLGQGLDIPLRNKRMRRCSSTYCLCIIQWFFSCQDILWCHLGLGPYWTGGHSFTELSKPPRIVISQLHPCSHGSEWHFACCCC